MTYDFSKLNICAILSVILSFIRGLEVCFRMEDWLREILPEETPEGKGNIMDDEARIVLEELFLFTVERKKKAYSNFINCVLWGGIGCLLHTFG